MAYNVRIMEKAEQDLSEIVTYFTDKLCNPKAAESLLEEFLIPFGISAYKLACPFLRNK